MTHRYWVHFTIGVGTARWGDAHRATGIELEHPIANFDDVALIERIIRERVVLESPETTDKEMWTVIVLGWCKLEPQAFPSAMQFYGARDVFPPQQEPTPGHA